MLTVEYLVINLANTGEMSTPSNIVFVHALAVFFRGEGTADSKALLGTSFTLAFEAQPINEV